VTKSELDWSFMTDRLKSDKVRGDKVKGEGQQDDKRGVNGEISQILNSIIPDTDNICMSPFAKLFGFTASMVAHMNQRIQKNDETLQPANLKILNVQM
jgi:hypothetical protein